VGPDESTEITGVLDNFFEIALTRIPIAPHLDPNLVVRHDSSFAEKRVLYCKNHTTHFRPLLSRLLVDALSLISYLPQKLFAGGDLRRPLNSLR